MKQFNGLNIEESKKDLLNQVIGTDGITSICLKNNSTILVNDDATVTNMQSLIDNFEFVAPLNYNATAFLTSLLLDETLRPFAKDCYYGAISDCLRAANFKGLQAVIGMSIADPDSIGSDYLAGYFSQKLFDETGVQLGG